MADTLNLQADIEKVLGEVLKCAPDVQHAFRRIGCAASLYRASPAAAVPENATSIYREALEHAAFYVRDHLQHGEEHMDIIATLKMPSKYEAAPAVPEGALPPLLMGERAHFDALYKEHIDRSATFGMLHVAWETKVGKFYRAAVEADRAHRPETVTLNGRTHTAAEVKQRILDLDAENAALHEQHEQHQQHERGAQHIAKLEAALADRAQCPQSDLYKTVIGHCNNLSDCAAMLDEDGRFKATAAEIRVAVSELRAAVKADRAQQGEPVGWRDALEQARYALKEAPGLHSLGFNECLANTLPLGQPDETGYTSGEYAQAAESIREAIRKARDMVRDALDRAATKAAAPADAPTVKNVLSVEAERRKFEGWARADLNMPDDMPFIWTSDWSKASWEAWMAAKVCAWLDAPSDMAVGHAAISEDLAERFRAAVEVDPSHPLEAKAGEKNNG